MMFWKKKKQINLFEDPALLKIHYLKQKAQINEQQHRLGIVSNGEYLATLRDINDYIDKMENKPAIEPIEMFNE